MGVTFKRFESLDFWKILKNGATQEWDDPKKVPYAYQGNVWVGYDNVNSFNIKVRSVPWICWGPSPESQKSKWFLLSSFFKQPQWLKSNQFGGAMVWAIDLDDFTGTFCNQGKFPLISTLKKVLSLQSASKGLGGNAQVYKCPFSNSKSNPDVFPPTLCPGILFPLHLTAPAQVRDRFHPWTAMSGTLCTYGKPGLTGWVF